MSDLEICPIKKNFPVSISTIKNPSIISPDEVDLYVFNMSLDTTTLPLGLFGYCDRNLAPDPLLERAYRIYNISTLYKICQSNILDAELSSNNIIKNPKLIIIIFRKTPEIKTAMQNGKYLTKQQQLLTMFSSQHSQINQDEVQNLASFF